MTNRFTKTSTFVQGGIMRPPSDGGLKTTVNNWTIFTVLEQYEAIDSLI